ncbi:hypothetical protein EV673_2466 [Limnobacter thiooxidans]|mgnify:FL=1|nr:hypothetical protein EV673_2466 [Limnobacter thiooxidans]
MNERIQVIMTAFEHELHNNPNLEIAEAIEVAKAKISEKFPEIGQSGLDALERAFSYWFK